MGDNPELEAEQAYVDRAYQRLDRLRSDTEERLRSVLDQGRGGTHQFREERDVIVRTSLARLDQLDIGDQALCFGRIDRLADEGGVESFHIGRLGISAEDLDPLVVDWRAPVAEPFYRATGRDPMGLVLRRHLAADGRRIVGLEDERFGSNGASAVTGDGATAGAISDDMEVGGPGALLAAVEGARTGHMRDIVATIQREQDEIIRSPLPGVLVVQGGPGTGKTAVALHRAAYLLYTHRFPLERQGVLVIGPNPLFLRYIEQVLPSLGESGVTLSTIGGLVHGVSPRAEEPAALARLKGEARMAKLLWRAVRTRQRPLPRTAEIPFGAGVLRLSAAVSADVVASARRRPGTHNARRKFVEQLILRRLADDHLRAMDVHGTRLATSGHSNGHRETLERGDEELAGFDFADFSAQLRTEPKLLEVLDRMWPRLSAEELLNDLFGSPPLLALAAKGLLSPEEQAMLVRWRRSSSAEIPFTPADLALLDEARVLLGPRRPRRPGAAGEADEPRTYGHIVVDEAQDLSPMQLRMLARRSLSGSMTVVGDIAQATGSWAPAGWEEVVRHLSPQRPPRLVELTVSYRTPAEVVAVAARVLAVAAPEIAPPRPVRQAGEQPRVVRTDRAGLGPRLAALAREDVRAVAPGRVAVLGPAVMLNEITRALHEAGLDPVDPRDPAGEGLAAGLVVLPADEANGLEFDAVIVVEPSLVAAVGEEPAGEAPPVATVRGLRTLYVALTRPTRRLTVLHTEPLPVELR